jgi:DNA-binding GntR family transcriptional regulator
MMVDRSSSLKSRVAGEVRNRILDGRLRLGERLSDKALAEEMESSRTPVREALLQLQSEGLVTMRPQSGTFVFDLTAEEIGDLCRLRGIYEAGALGLAAARDPDGTVKALNAIVAGAALALQDGDLDRCEGLDTEFHETLVSLSGSPLLAQAYRSLSARVRALRHRLPQESQRYSEAIAQHRRIVDCLATGRAEQAGKETIAHVGNVRRLLAAR